MGKWKIIKNKTFEGTVFESGNSLELAEASKLAQV